MCGLRGTLGAVCRLNQHNKVSINPRPHVYFSIAMARTVYIPIKPSRRRHVCTLCCEEHAGIPDYRSPQTPKINSLCMKSA